MLCELVVGAIYGTVTTSFAGSNLWEYFGRGRPTVIQALYVCGKNSAPKTMEFAILYHGTGEFTICIQDKEKDEDIGGQFKKQAYSLEELL